MTPSAPERLGSDLGVACYRFAAKSGPKRFLMDFGPILVSFFEPQTFEIITFLINFLNNFATPFPLNHGPAECT